MFGPLKIPRGSCGARPCGQRLDSIPLPRLFTILYFTVNFYIVCSLLISPSKFDKSVVVILSRCWLAAADKGRSHPNMRSCRRNPVEQSSAVQSCTASHDDIRLPGEWKGYVVFQTCWLNCILTYENRSWDKLGLEVRCSLWPAINIGHTDYQLSFYHSSQQYMSQGQKTFVLKQCFSHFSLSRRVPWDIRIRRAAFKNRSTLFGTAWKNMWCVYSGAVGDSCYVDNRGDTQFTGSGQIGCGRNERWARPVQDSVQNHGLRQCYLKRRAFSQIFANCINLRNAYVNLGLYSSLVVIVEIVGVQKGTKCIAPDWKSMEQIQLRRSEG